MSKIFSVTKGEFYRYFISPLAYVYLISFLVLNASFSLYFGGIFTSGNASLKPMFDFLPWIYLLFIPGIAMRLWAEEFKSGTILQIITLPVSTNAYVWGKFLAAWAFCALALLLTFPFVITINVLGSPDNWVIFNSYLGALLLAGAMLAISQTASAVTKSQVIALVIAVILNLLFFLSGLEYVLSFFRGFAPNYIINMISSFSFLTHINLFGFGLFELHSFIFLASIIIIFNVFTFLIINLKTSGITPWLKTNSALGLSLAIFLIFSIFVGVNLFSNTTLRRFRMDFTSEKLFTPSDATRKILQNLPSPVTAKLFYSPILGERDEQMRLAFDNLHLLLQIYRQISNGKFNYGIYDPIPLSDIEDKAIQAKILGIPLPDLNAAAYFGMVLVNENGQSNTIPFVPLAKGTLLEQALTENIYLLEHQKKTLGILSTLPILGSSFENSFLQPWQIAEEIRKYYNIKKINSPDDIKEIDALMIIHPQELSSEMEQAIYDYSLNNGKILAFFDIAPEALRLIGPQTQLSTVSDYGSLPEKWGFRFFKYNVVADLYNSSQATVETPDYSGVSQDLIQFYLTSKNFFEDLPETGNLKRMLLTSASTFLPLKEAPIYFIPLIQASEQSQLMSSKVVTQNTHPAEILRQFKADQKAKYLAAHIVSQDPDKPFELIVVGDSDLLYDSFWTTSKNIGNKIFNVPLLDNGNFVLNSLDVLTGNNALIGLRGKAPLLRPFTSLEQQQKEILRQFKIKEKDIFDQISFIKHGLQEIWSKKEFEARQNFTPDELSIITKIKKTLEQKKRELYNIRINLNQNMQSAEFWVKFFNIYTIPSLIILGILIFNSRNLKLCKPKRPKFNRCFAYLLLGALTCLIMGFGSVRFLNEKDSLSFENEALFPKLSEQINDVTQIRFQNHNQELIITKQGDSWILPNHPEFLVNQNRVKSFLTALIQATLYEKKADKVENLPKFGLLPLDNPESKTTAVTLSNASGAPLLSFETGEYNIELSRGALGAYIRLPNKFQIWLAEIELVDLNIDYRYWSYAHLWNLQFGRFATLNKTNNVDLIAKMASILLNTPLKATDQTPQNSPTVSLDFSGEYFNQLILDFYEQNQKSFVKFSFDGIKNNPILKNFADKVQNKFYQIPNNDMEKIKDALNSRTSK